MFSALLFSPCDANVHAFRISNLPLTVLQVLIWLLLTVDSPVEFCLEQLFQSLTCKGFPIDHGRLWSFALPCACAESTWTSWATSSFAVFSQMVWSCGLSCPDLTQHATTSESTKMASVPVGTPPQRSIVSSDTTLLPSHTSIHVTVSTSINTHHASTYSVQLWQQWSHPCLWLPSERSLASRPRSLRQPEDHWLDISRSDSLFSFHSEAGRRRLWSWSPLTLPVAALLVQQANNHWLRKLAHGRELYL